MTAALKSGMIAVNGTELHVMSAGNGFPIVFIHGWPQTWFEWRHLMAALAPRFRVIALDLRGMGESAPCPTGQDKRTLAADVRALLAALGIHRAVIVGHDWGGAVAQRVVLDYPDVAERLICLDIPCFFSTARSNLFTYDRLQHSWYLFFHQQPILPELVAEHLGEAYLSWFFNHGAASGRSPLNAEETAEYVRAFTLPGRSTAGFNLYRTMFTTDAADWASQIGTVLDLPTLWLAGAESTYVPPGSYIESLPASFRNLTTQVFDQCGHWIPEEQPQRTVAAFESFLADLA